MKFTISSTTLSWDVNRYKGLQNNFDMMMEYYPGLKQFDLEMDEDTSEIFPCITLNTIVTYSAYYRFDDDEDLKNLAEPAYKEQRKAVVTFENGKFSPSPTRCDCDDFWYSWAFDDFEVIGNIYDNPELLAHD